MKDNKKLIGIFADNYDRLAKIAIRVVGDKDTSLDVLQDVALILIRKEYQINVSADDKMQENAG